jgi:hypothetical protein
MDPQEKWESITAVAGGWLFHAAQSAKPAQLDNTGKTYILYGNCQKLTLEGGKGL